MLGFDLRHIDRLKKIIKMLTNVFRVLVNNSFKENFYGKRNQKKENAIIVLIAFFISHKNGIKIFIKWIINQYHKNTC